MLVCLGLVASALAGCGSSASGDESSPEVEAAQSGYRDYLRENAEELSRRIERMQEVIERETGREPAPPSETIYAIARVPYGHIDSFVRLYPPLQRGIDGLAEEVPPDEYGGFHRLEKEFFWQEVTMEMGPVAKQLAADIEAVRERIDSDELQPAEIVSGIKRSSDEIVTNVFPGDTERWSHLDLLDAAAMMEGAKEAFKVAQPVLAEANPELSKEIEAQLEKGLETMDEYGTLASNADPSEPLRAGTGFYIYDQMVQEERWELVEPFKKLSALLAQAEEELG
ncbi:MAG TPA: EfeM/EfeO family lipoprotein [Solirubrobacterales bacterium]|nr:EfeM/EfeO family lipoprotein [Solirubrobacterales bacterium]